MDEFLEEWPKEIEELLPSILSADIESLDCSLETMVDLLCSKFFIILNYPDLCIFLMHELTDLLDIPVKENQIEALHILTTIYAEQKQFLINRNKFRAHCRRQDRNGSVKSSEFSTANPADQHLPLEIQDHLILR